MFAPQRLLVHLSKNNIAWSNTFVKLQPQGTEGGICRLKTWTLLITFPKGMPEQCLPSGHSKYYFCKPYLTKNWKLVPYVLASEKVLCKIFLVPVTIPSIIYVYTTLETEENQTKTYISVPLTKMINNKKIVCFEK